MTARAAPDVRAILELDRVIHEPARLAIVAVLATAEADFRYLESVLGLSKGTLSTHMAKLADAGYVEVTKQFLAQRPNTSYRLTDRGRAAFDAYRAALARDVVP